MEGDWSGKSGNLYIGTPYEENIIKIKLKKIGGENMLHFHKDSIYILVSNFSDLYWSGRLSL